MGRKANRQMERKDPHMNENSDLDRNEIGSRCIQKTDVHRETNTGATHTGNLQ